MAQTIMRVMLAPMSIPFAWCIGFIIAGMSLFAQLAGLNAIARLCGELIGTLVLECSGKRQCAFPPRHPKQMCPGPLAFVLPRWRALVLSTTRVKVIQAPTVKVIQAPTAWVTCHVTVARNRTMSRGGH